MYRQLFSREQQDEIRHVVPAAEYLSQHIIKNSSPFSSPSLYTELKVFVMEIFVRLLERIGGEKLYISNKYREFFAIDSRIRTLISFLLEKRIINSWEISPLTPDQPHNALSLCIIDIAPIAMPSGTTRKLSSSGGQGVGATANEAFIPSLGEALERYSLCKWDPGKLVYGSYEQLQKKGAIHPDSFSFFTKDQLEDDKLKRNRTSPTQKIHWASARSLTNGKKCLIPAQLIYIFYNREHLEEPVFYETTTNGAAAGQGFHDAAVRAISEAIERDAFLVFWLNKLTPHKLNLYSIPSERIQSHIKEIESYNLRLYILDITTDISLPTFVAVLIDNHGDQTVSISAVSDFDIIRGLEKIVLSVTRFVHFSSEYSSAKVREVQKKYPHLTSMFERRILWADKKMLKHIQFFLEGEYKDFSEITGTYPPSPSTAKQKLHTLRDMLADKKYPCYLVDVATPEARSAGLSVVKAVIPDLVPMYFNEKMKPLAVKHLHDAPQAMGRRTSKVVGNEFNPTPHPFV